MIRFENVTKVYKTSGHRRTVLDRASFTMRSGVSYGILGINGAGKSTMIRMMAGAEGLTKGRIIRTSRVSWPLGFAGGFHPMMTGKENAIFVARVYGEDPRKVLDFVTDFAEIGDYINVPIRTYSSGMSSRFNFGMSMAIPFDTYLIDEITSVGDARFQARCEEVWSKRRANADIIMCSHNMDVLRQYSSEGIVLANGRAVIYSDINDAIEVYQRLNQ
ncbi:ABC transporter ATP-binding protein [Methylobacterium sp. ID0610]|uniref:ABC transporter ATP-binding protein n=1 Tax=Methylobacterium carpenticola TaxID=3344827 RepID=UPI0036C5E716